MVESIIESWGIISSLRWNIMIWKIAPCANIVAGLTVLRTKPGSVEWHCHRWRRPHSTLPRRKAIPYNSFKPILVQISQNHPKFLYWPDIHRWHTFFSQSNLPQCVTYFSWLEQFNIYILFRFVNCSNNTF